MPKITSKLPVRYESSWANRQVSDSAGFAHFEYLISMKSFVAYGDRRLDEKRWMRVNLCAERFANWVLKIAKELKMEGWNHDEV